MRLKIKYKSVIYGLIFIFATLAIGLAFCEIEVNFPMYEISLLFLVIWYFFEIDKKKDYLHKMLLIIYLYFTVNIIINYLNNNLLPLETITLIANFIFLHIIADDRKKSNLENPFIFWGIIGSIMLVYGFQNGAKLWWGNSAYTIGDFNPQGIGNWAVIFSAVLIMVLNYCNIRKVRFKFLIKIASYSLICYFVYITWSTQSRTALAVVVLMLILHFLPAYKFLISKTMACVFALLPLCICIIAILFYLYGGGNSLSGNSLLNGREELWIYCLQELFKHPLVGNSMYGETIYTHNVFLDLLVSYGCFITISFIVIQICAMMRVVKYIKTKLQYDLYIAFVGCLILGSCEGSVFLTGVGGLFIYAYSFLVIISSFEATKNLEDQERNVFK